MSARNRVVLTAEQAARRAADIERLDGWALALTCDNHDQDFDDLHTDDIDEIDDETVPLPDENADADADSDEILASGTDEFDLLDADFAPESKLLEHGDDYFDDWCISARLKKLSGNADAGAEYLKKIGDSGSHKSIYLKSSQEANTHDRLMADVPADGRKKGGTSGVAPELRKKSRSAKIVNEQLLRWNCSEEENAEAEAWRIAGNARLARKSAYILSVYDGNNRDVLELLLQSIEHREIAKIVGKSTRMIRYIVHGNHSKGRKAQPGLLQIINEIMSRGVPSDFQSDAQIMAVQPFAVRVEPIKSRKKSLQSQAVAGQLAWVFAEMGVAA